MTKLISIILILTTNPVLACGNVSQQFQAYWSKKSSDEKSKFLSGSNNSSPVNYSPTRDDRQIVSVLVDAINSGVRKKTICKTLRNYQCAASERNSEDYKYITNQLGDTLFKQYCPRFYIDSIYQIKANSGANLRDQPNKNGKVIGSIANGNAIEMIAKTKDWSKVKTYSGIGYIYSSLIFKP